MVESKHTQYKVSKAERSAFTMIELIFAIVIIGISMLSLPTLMVGNANNQESSITQEGIMLAATKVSNVLSFPWDPNLVGFGIATAAPVLETGGDSELENRNAANLDFRVGHFPEKLRRRKTPNAAPLGATAIGGAVVPSASINDLNGENAVVGAVDNAANQHSFKKQWTLVTAVSYVSDTAAYAGNPINFNFSVVPTGTTNIKMVRTMATDNDGNQVQLTSFTSNIGESEFYKRRY